MRTPTRLAQRARKTRMSSFRPPTGGWISNRNLASPRGPDLPPGAAILDNWFPMDTSVVLRRGSAIWATLGNTGEPCTSLFTYKAGAQSEMFGATPSAIYNITTVASPTNWMMAANGAEEVIAVDDTPDNEVVLGESSTQDLGVMTGLTGGDWSVVQFSTAGGTFLRGVNGADAPFIYDGSTFSATPAITFPSGDTTVASNLSYVWTFRNRLWFVKKDSMDAYYLPIDSISGEAVAFPLGGVFNMGGSIMFGASWSLDRGDAGGLGAQCVFVTTEGEVAVYQGSDPGSAADWSLVGVYRIGKPLGPKAHIMAGGDIVIATTIGFVPLSTAIARDYAAISPVSLSNPIEVAWEETVEQRGQGGWNCILWPEGQMAIVSAPAPDNGVPDVMVTNAISNAWTRFTNWQASCMTTFNGGLFFGSTDGTVTRAYVGGTDRGVPYVGSCLPLFDDLRSPASLKPVELARVVLRSTVETPLTVSAQFDWDMALPPPPNAPMIGTLSVWDAGIWDESIWDEVTPSLVSQSWDSVGGAGYAIAIGVQVTSGGDIPLDAEILRIDITYATGDFVS